MKNPQTPLTIVNIRYVVFSVIGLVTIALIALLYFKGLVVRNISVNAFVTDTTQQSVQLQHVSKEDVIATLNAEIGKPIIAVNKQALEQILQQKYYWAKNVYITKKYPNTLEIWIQERKIDLCIEIDKDLYAISENMAIDRVTQDQCSFVAKDLRDKSYTNAEILTDQVYYCALEIHDQLNKYDTLSTHFADCSFIIDEYGSVAFGNLQTEAVIECNTNIENAIRYLNQAFILYPEYQEARHVTIYNDKFVLQME